MVLPRGQRRRTSLKETPQSLAESGISKSLFQHERYTGFKKIQKYIGKQLEFKLGLTKNPQSENLTPVVYFFSKKG